MNDSKHSRDGLIDQLRTEAEFLFRPELQVHIVGSRARHEALRRRGIASPQPKDLDFCWGIDVDEGERVLETEGVLRSVTSHAKGRGTLAFQCGDQRCEITAFRGGSSIEEDLLCRDATINAFAWRLQDDKLLDPTGGLNDWKDSRLRAVGDARERIEEHPIRLFRYYRQAATQGLQLDPAIRKVRFDSGWLESVPSEAWAAELRRGLLEAASPGKLCLELAEIGSFRDLAPDLHGQFDGRPAGPVRYHPEVSQGLHLALSLDWAADHSRAMSPEDRNRLLVAVLCHDLGKSRTPADEFPSHRGHEHGGLPLVDEFLDQLPGLTDQAGRRVSKLVCELHLQVRRLHEVKPGSLARFYERHLRPKDFPVNIFALAVAADSAGRLGYVEIGEPTRSAIEQNLRAIRSTCEQVDVGALRAQFEDLEQFREALHQERARSLRSVELIAL
ncbi:MAG: HD domain-containing protein [Planctomycetota bacterium]